MRVPKDLVLSAGLVEEHGKVDRELREVLEGVEGRREGGDGDGGLEKVCVFLFFSFPSFFLQGGLYDVGEK